MHITVTASDLLVGPQHAGQGEDCFASAEELVQCIRPGVLLEAASLPCLSITDRHGRVAHLNNYIVDWWSNGRIKLLETANGLQEGESAAALLHCIPCDCVQYHCCFSNSECCTKCKSSWVAQQCYCWLTGAHHQSEKG